MPSGRIPTRRTPSIYVAVTQADHLLDYTIQITANHKRFPKHLRYQLSDKLVYIACDIAADLRVGAQLQPNNLKAIKRIQKKLEDAIDNMAKYESLMVLASKWCDPGNIEYWDYIFSTLQSSILKWLADIHRRRRNLMPKNSESDAVIYRKIDTGVAHNNSKMHKLIYTGFDSNSAKDSCYKLYGKR